MYKIQNNFSAYMEQFKKDTGLNAKENMEMFINYYNARCADNSAQLLAALLTEVGNWRSNWNQSLVKK